MNELRPIKAHLWEKHQDNFYVEPPWCSRRLFQEERFPGQIHDPACGLGRIVLSAHDAGLEAWGADKVRRSHFCREEIDFLTQGPSYFGISNIVCNPPFKLARQFVEKALEIAARKVAMLLPTPWLHGDTRSRWLETTPLKRVLFLTPRPSMPPGPIIEAGIAPGGGRADFAWLIWERGLRGWPLQELCRPELGWLRRDG